MQLNGGRIEPIPEYPKNRTKNKLVVNCPKKIVAKAIPRYAKEKEKYL